MGFIHFLVNNLFIRFHRGYFLFVYRLTILLSHQFGMAVMVGSLFKPLLGEPGIFSRINGLFIRLLSLFFGALIIIAFILLGIGIYLSIILLPFYLIVNYPIYFILLVLFIFALFAYKYYFGVPYKILNKDNIQEYFHAGTNFERKSLLSLRIGDDNAFYSFALKSEEINLLLKRSEIEPDPLFKFIELNRAEFNPNKFLQDLIELTKKTESDRIHLEILFAAYVSNFEGFENFIRKFNITHEIFIQALCFTIFLKQREPYIWESDYIIPPAGGVDKGWAVGFTSNLNKYGFDLTKAALKGEMPKLYGRDSTKTSFIDILSKNSRNNVLLIGQSGAGKTTFVRAIAREIALGTNIPALRFKRIVLLDTGAILSGDSGEINKKITSIMKEAESAGNIIIFIDEIHSIAGNVFNIIEPYLSSGKFQFIATTSRQNYAKFIQPNDSFSRTFDIIDLPEATESETIEIMQDQVMRLESSQPSGSSILITLPAILTTIDLAKKYVHNRAFPDKSAELLNQAFARVKSVEDSVLNRDLVTNLISEAMGLPIKAIDDNEQEILMNLDKLLHSQVVGQNLAIESISKALKRSRAGVRNENKPIASFLFAGPTGVGKTETAKSLANLYFGSENSMIRIDMSEYQTPESIGRLIGSGTGEIGQLISKVQAKPYSVVLLDEIEKAHPSVLNLFLQVLDEGYLTSATGEKTYFSSTFIIMTTNVGTRELMNALANGIRSEDVNEVIIDSLKSHFAPEFLNRFTGMIPFMSLNDQDVLDVVKLKLNAFAKNIKDTKQIDLQFNDTVVSEIADRAVTSEWGVRSVNRIIEDKIETLIADKLIQNEIKSGDSYLIEHLDG